MKLYIGGCNQGKLNYAIVKNNINENEIINGEFCDLKDMLSAVSIYRLNEWIKRNIDENTVNKLCDMLIYENPNVIIICDEVGYGIVPIDKTERIYRELVGRCLIRLAAASKEVERVVCGIGVKIK